MKKAIMNTMIILFALAMCVGCGQSSEQKEESVPTDVTKAEARPCDLFVCGNEGWNTYELQGH